MNRTRPLGSKAVALLVVSLMAGSFLALTPIRVTDSDGGTATWTNLSPSSAPTVRSAPAMAYDSADGYIVLFGGGTSAGVLEDTWTFANGVWTQLSPETSPPARQGAAMVYDAADGYVLLFGGDGNSQALGDTWMFKAGVWTQLAPTNSPSARGFSSIAYDAADGYVVLFGGCCVYSDTWKFNAGQWTQLSPSQSPPGRESAGMAYDTTDGYVVMFAGDSNPWSSGAGLDDTWRFAGGSWNQLSPSASPPDMDVIEMMTNDPAINGVMLFGGWIPAGSCGSDYGGTWMFSGGSWTQLSPSSSPPAMQAAGMTLDSTSSNVILFGGTINEGASPSAGCGTPITQGATWEYGVPSLTAPSGIVAYVPITLTNSQTSPTPAPFQQIITVNSATFATYEASNLQNVEFFDSTGTVIPSWLESGASSSSTSSIYWLMISGGIPADSSVTVYMGFASPTTNLFNALTTGEAPNLSPMYGQYDDGANVFAYYWNFAGTSLPSDWAFSQYVPQGGYSVDNGASFYTGSGSENAMFGYFQTPLNAGSYVISTNMSSYAAGNNGEGVYFGWWSDPFAPLGSGFIGNYVYDFIGCPFFNCFSQLSGYLSTFDVISNGGTAASANTYDAQQPMGYSLSWLNENQVGTLIPLSGAAVTVSQEQSSPAQGSYYLGFWAPTAGEGNNGETAQWVSVSSMPPNGLMPGVTIGSPVSLLLTDTAPTIIPIEGEFTIGQSLTLTVTGSGTGPYALYLVAMPTPNCIGASSLIGSAVESGTEPAAASYTWNPTIATASADDTNICAVVTDSGTGQTLVSGVTSFVVATPMASYNSDAEDTVAVTLGQTVVLTDYPSGGAPPYTYQWYYPAGYSVSAPVTCNTAGTGVSSGIEDPAGTSNPYTVPTGTDTSYPDLGTYTFGVVVTDSTFGTPPNTICETVAVTITETATISGGGATVDQTSATGIDVTITESSARDGTSVTVTSEDWGTTQPPGTGSVNLDTQPSPVYFDVQIEGISDGWAKVCITDASVSSTPGATVMEYFAPPSNWPEAASVADGPETGGFVSGTGPTYTICGYIPVPALNGTPIVIGTPPTTTTTTTTTTTSSTRTRIAIEFSYYPSIALALSSSTIKEGGSVTGSATLTGAASNAGGTVGYYYFSGSLCWGDANVVGSPVTVTNGMVPNSQPQMLSTPGSYSWLAFYSGDANDYHAMSACEQLTATDPATPSVTTTTVAVTTNLPPTILTVHCNYASVVVGSTVTCKAKVVGSGSVPTGSVTWSDSRSGEFSKLTCKLSKGTCSVKFTPTAAGSSVILTASYGGDSKNAPSARKYSLTVAMRATKTTVSCTPKSAAAGSTTVIICKAKVTGFSPTGTVTWTQSGTGSVSFDSATCTLSQGTCSVTMTASTSGRVTITATYTGDPNNQGGSRTAKLTIKNAT